MPTTGMADRAAGSAASDAQPRRTPASASDPAPPRTRFSSMNPSFQLAGNGEVRVI